jgi:hypothetical protein
MPKQKTLSALLFVIMLSASHGLRADDGQTDKPTAKSKADYTLATPQGWRTERISLPPAFASTMSWKGHEDIRFAPGMFQQDKDDFFTYFVLFWIEGKPDLANKPLAKEVAAYYQGLSKAVLKSRTPGKKADKVKISFRPVESEGKASDSVPDNTSDWRLAELQWTEPFTTAAPQKLSLKLKTGVVGDHSFVIMLVSPSEKKSVWKPLRKLADGLKFSK